MEREAEWLLRDKYDGVETPEYHKDLERLAAGEPLAYTIGWTPFLNTKIFLDSRPLIPRPETEYWVGNAIAEAEKNSKPLKILDLCAGSGCIGVAVLKALPNSTVDFIEIDPAHHPLIAKNIRENSIDESRTRILGGDLFENAGTGYDLILSNPPYIDPALQRTDGSVLNHEPHLALFGGERGMEIIERIIADGPAHLALGGTLYIEHEPEQAEAIAKLLPGSVQLKDQFGLIRVTRYKK
ncbi:MAG TPA: peptide chain release factor N(5)-glutamine methyltransferase [Candidatus Paceibacterota bacterium]|jgi:HemK-like putative methylase|nr:peptide chain release factor N(5)-glutamine methyltransferase [Candidatus Paceibacterota bacterium]